MKHELITLPYAADALAPVISKETIEYHHGKHLKGYVDTLNSLIEGTELENASLEDIVMKAEGKTFNQAGQIFNHNAYFLQMQPTKENNKPEGVLLAAIEKEWGSFEKFQEAFEEAAKGLFGSGWAWLVSDNAGKLSIEKYGNAGCPLREGLKGLLTFDVWEHAYYIDYRNSRPNHVKELWKIINWQVVAARM